MTIVQKLKVLKCKYLIIEYRFTTYEIEYTTTIEIADLFSLSPKSYMKRQAAYPETCTK